MPWFKKIIIYYELLVNKRLKKNLNTLTCKQYVQLRAL